MEHLALEVFDLATKENPNPTGSQYAVLAPDATITITDTSEIFADGDVWSNDFTLNIRANAHLFGTAGEIHGSRLYEQINKRKARLWVEGIPLYLGYLMLGSEAEVDAGGNVDVSFESGQKTFENLIDGAKANQVPLLGDVQIGMALWRKRWVKCALVLKATVRFKDGFTASSETIGGGTVFESDGDNADTPTQQYPRMVFPRGEFLNTISEEWEEPIDCLNTDLPYTEDENGTPTNPFCNISLCYQKYGYRRKDENGNEKDDYSAEPEAERGYEIMPADRVNSAPNFFVAYWVRALMTHLDIHIDENQMMDVEDLRRLFFVNTNCAYKVPEQIRDETEETKFGRFKRARFGFHHPYDYVPERIDSRPLIKQEESKFNKITYQAEIIESDPRAWEDEDQKTIDKVGVEVVGVKDWGLTDQDPWPRASEYLNNNSYFHIAYATSECFPNVDIAEVISALENGFGIRFLFNDNYTRVRIVLLRNIFRSKKVQNIVCDIIEDSKVENNIKGFRMTYDNTEDTHFYYKGFADMLPHKKKLWPDNSDTHDYSQWKLNARYSDLINNISVFDKTCYYTPATGDAYGIKVDKNAKRYDEQYPSLFEYAGFMDAEDGDCTGEEDTIETVSMGFVPAIQNDVNIAAQRSGESSEQHFALFVDEKMRPRRPDLHQDKDYNKSDANYDVNSVLYGKSEDGDYNYASMMADGYVAPGEFAITSDMAASARGLSATVDRYKFMGMSGARLRVNLSMMDIEGHINEGYRLYLQDNYEPNDDGVSPIETHDWGLTLGIMRGSGSDASVEYEQDPDDLEENDTWHIRPGKNATAHPDTCDNYGNEWDYDGSFVVTPENAPAKLAELFPNSDAPFNDASMGYITGTTWIYVRDNSGVRRSVLIASAYSIAGETVSGSGDLRYFVNLTLEQLQELSRTSRHMIVEVDSNDERGNTLVQLCKLAYGGGTEPVIIDNGVSSRYGRFSLKLRSEKPNPKFNPDAAESSINPRYLPVSNENLRRRGLCDVFYQEYSFWTRNARIAHRKVRMTMAQLLAIDTTERVTVGDICGFVRKMQFNVDNMSGLGLVTMEIMYI